MIAVIADDFTGAAEIGGIGLRYGLSVVIETDDIQNCTADLLVVATDTRSLPAKEASKHIAKITNELKKLNPEFVFKKIDSVLRGNIADEILAQMKASGQKRSIIVAANPVFNRIIRDGIYYIDETPLNETSFSTDPEYPVVSSEVLKIVGGGKSSFITNLKSHSKLPDNGLIIGDVTGFDDLDSWVKHIDCDTLPAGSSGFFDAFLSQHLPSNIKSQIPNVPVGERAFIVLGSSFPKEGDFMKRLQKAGCMLSNMPDEIYHNKNFDSAHLMAWVDEIVDGLRNNKKVAASIMHPYSDEPELSLRLKETMGQLIKLVVDRIDVDELLIEGGGTTSVALQYLGIKKLYPVQELETGVIRMKTNGGYNMCLTTKPGSYQWPDNMWVM